MMTTQNELHEFFAESNDFDLCDALALVPKELLGNTEAIELHASPERAREEAAQHMDEKFISDHPDFVGKLAKYPRARRDSFGDMLSTLRAQHRRVNQAIGK